MSKYNSGLYKSHIKTTIQYYHSSLTGIVYGIKIFTYRYRGLFLSLNSNYWIHFNAITLTVGLFFRNTWGWEPLVYSSYLLRAIEKSPPMAVVIVPPYRPPLPLPPPQEPTGAAASTPWRWGTWSTWCTSCTRPCTSPTTTSCRRGTCWSAWTASSSSCPPWRR